MNNLNFSYLDNVNATLFERVSWSVLVGIVEVGLYIAQELVVSSKFPQDWEDHT